MDELVKKKRLEDKYVLSAEEYKSLIPIVKRNLSLYQYTDKKTSYTAITSVYLDSDDLVCFRKHADGEPKRAKVRIRSYAPDGKPDDHTFIEIKEKTGDGDLGTKSRIELDDANLTLVKKGEHILMSDALVSKNKALSYDDLLNIVQRLNGFVVQNDMRPAIKMTYDRVAYGSDAFRITFDQDLKWTWQQFTKSGKAQDVKESCDWGSAKERDEQYQPGDVIMEIKHQGPLPKWLFLALWHAKLKEPIKFSKYVRCCVQMINRLLVAPE